MTQQGLAKMLKTVREVEADLPANVTETEIKRVNHERFDLVRHELAMPLVNGGNWNWPLAEPNKLLALMVSESRALQDLFAAALSRSGVPSQESPWTLAIGYDEFCPGGMFSVADGRKSMNLSFTFLELGVFNIRSDNAWFTPVCVRHAWFKEIQGGWGAMFAKYLKLHLLGPTGLATAGAPITVCGTDVLIFASLDFMIADLDGHRMSLNSNGANGFRPCLRHCNVLKKDSGTAELDPAANFVEVSCADPTRFRLHTSADVFTAADLVSAVHAQWTAGMMTKTRFENLQKTCGLKFEPDGILLDPELRRHVDVVDSTVIDWVHTALQDGVFTTEAFLLVQACGEVLDIGFGDLREYMKDGWKFPAWGRTKSKELFRIFDEARSPKEDKIRASASELLGMYALIRHFVERHLLDVAAEGFQRQTASFQAACATIDLISLVKQGRVGLREGSVQLRRAHAEHLRLHIEAYGTANILPKHHMMFDVADQWERRGAVIDAFVVERLHIRIKYIMDPIRNTRDFEVSCLASLINAHVMALGDHEFGDALLGRTSLLPGTMVRIADKMTVAGNSIEVGDIVLLHDAAGRVCACAADNGQYLVLVETFEKVVRLTAHSDRWKVGGRLEAWPADAVLSASAWYMCGPGLADVAVLRVV